MLRLAVVITVLLAVALAPAASAMGHLPDPGEVTTRSCETSQYQTRGREAKEAPYVALGDSIASGLGAKLTPGGYVAILAEELGVEVANEAVPGVSSCGLLQQLYNEDSTITGLGTAQYVTISIGGNDLLRCAGMAHRTLDALCAARAAADFHTTWPQILERLRALTPEATVQVLTVYNPYPADHPLQREADYYIRWLNQEIGRVDLVQAHGYQVVDAYGALSGDCSLIRFCGERADIHPSDQGHQVLAGLHQQDGEAGD